MLTLNKDHITNFKSLRGFIKKIILFILCASCLVITACSANKDEDTSQTKEETTKTEIAVEQATSSDVVAEVQANKDKWLSQEINAYQIEMQKICFCAPDAVRMMIFKVANNEIKEVRYADSGDEVDPSHYNQHSTIEGMFTLVELALEKNPADLTIAYDAEYGYIKELTVDYQANIADDEITIIASNMKPMKPK